MCICTISCFEVVEVATINKASVSSARNSKTSASSASVACARVQAEVAKVREMLAKRLNWEWKRLPGWRS